MGNLVLTQIADWQAIDEIYENNDVIMGVWVDNTFLELDKFVRFGTPWFGEAPKCVNEYGQEIIVHGVSTDIYYPYYIQLNDSCDYARLWRVAIPKEKVG